MVWGIAKHVLVQASSDHQRSCAHADVKLAATVSPSTSSRKAPNLPHHRVLVVLQLPVCLSQRQPFRVVAKPSISTISSGEPLSGAWSCCDSQNRHSQRARDSDDVPCISTLFDCILRHSILSSPPASSTHPSLLHPRVIPSAAAHTLMLPASLGCSLLSPPSRLRHCIFDLTHPVYHAVA